MPRPKASGEFFGLVVTKKVGANCSSVFRFENADAPGVSGSTRTRSVVAELPSRARVPSSWVMPAGL